MKWLRRLDDAAGVRVDIRPMPGQSPEDQALIAKYYRAFPRRPIKGEHGGGGIIGWMNRLDGGSAR
jgi:hypothetical protein